MPIRNPVQGIGIDMVRRPRTAVRRHVLSALRVRARAQETAHRGSRAVQEHQERVSETDLRGPHPLARTLLQDMRRRQYK